MGYTVDNSNIINRKVYMKTLSDKLDILYLSYIHGEVTGNEVHRLLGEWTEA